MSYILAMNVFQELIVIVGRLNLGELARHQLIGGRYTRDNYRSTARRI
jgi:hypothetical protein